MDTIAGYMLIAAKGNIRKAVIDLLQENNLPVADLGPDKHLFALIQNNTILGTGGLEFFEDCALLRSVSVKKDYRGKRLGQIISKELEKISRQKEIGFLELILGIYYLDSK